MLLKRAIESLEYFQSRDLKGPGTPMNLLIETSQRSISDLDVLILVFNESLNVCLGGARKKIEIITLGPGMTGNEALCSFHVFQLK